MKGGLSVTSAIVTMVTSMMGTGINYMPYAFKSVGYIRGILLINGVGILTFFSLYAISIAANRSKEQNPTYSSLSTHISKALKILVDMSIFSSCFGVNIVFYRYLAELITIMVPIGKYVDPEIGRKIVIGALSIPFLLLSLQKNLSNLKVTSYITVASVSYLAVLMGIYCLFIGGKSAEEPMQRFGSNFSGGISCFMFALSCQANMVKTYTEMEHKSPSNIIKVAMGASLIGTLIYGSVGLCGYAVFGDTIKGSIIDILISPESSINLYLMRNTIDKYALSSKMACIGAMLVLFGAFPVQMNPLVGIPLSYFAREGSNEDAVRRKVVSVLMILFLSLSLLEDLNIDTILQMVGATAVNLVSFTYPFIYYLYFRSKVDFMSGLALFGIIGSIASMIYMSYNIMLS
ncbi:amino acid permease [Encephalitozoon intestinalis ATCC 50506]|uniref:Amino acid permease n=1 Tax=Encephalitozoon intestinalis (strain ATCC 50506) TaxID=876142 RepID=E0S6S1_ENCIT|nr:amino acid permease [Encephalitozoon intestinalis ATCC 50506]ADM11406.1 amino acid permease [Encephalitozoon intestinalis ATCC 50506]UTX45098.1 amino acid permease [Encephalitozoon intestinalis]